MPVTFSLVIVNFNSGAHLRRALESVSRSLTGAEWEGVVVDNASDQGADAGPIVADFPNVRLIRNATNVGFARGVNQGMAECRAPLVLLMNPDCYLLEDAVFLLAEELRTHPKCAIVSPAVLDEDGTVQGSPRGDPSMITGLFGRSTVFTRMFPTTHLARRNVRLEEALATPQVSTIVDWVAGACLLVRRETIERLGGFDDQFFLYWEDADLCRRARQAGFTTRFLPAARVVHLVGQSSQTAQEISIRAFHESAYIYYCKHITPRQLSPVRWTAKILLALRCRWKLMAASRRRAA